MISTWILKVNIFSLYPLQSHPPNATFYISDEPNGTWKESWRAMEYAVTKGKIRSLGVSNFNEEDIFELLRWSHKPVSVLQNWFDPFHQDNSIRKLCAEYNIRYMGYSTLGQFAYFIWKVYLKLLVTTYSLIMVKTFVHMFRHEVLMTAL